MFKMMFAAAMFVGGLSCMSAAHAQSTKTIFNNSKVPIVVAMTPSGETPLKAKIPPFMSHTFTYDVFGITTLVVTETTTVDSVMTTFRATTSSSEFPNINHTFNDNGTLVITFNPSSFSFGLTADQ